MRLSPNEVYVSIDIEADGPCPGLNSMMQLGAVAYDWKGNELGMFERNMFALPGAAPSPQTMGWWGSKENIDRLIELQKDRVDPLIAMGEWDLWMKQFVGTPVMIAYPASYDFSWMLYYCWRCLDRCPFSHSRVIDIKNITYALLPVTFKDAVKKRMPQVWTFGLPKHTHRAADDAREQGQLFFNIVRSVRQREEAKEDDHK